MARTLTETLAAAVDAPARQPAMQFTLRDAEHHYALYRSDPRSAAANACFVDMSGALWRVDVSTERGIVAATVSYQRIADPSQPSQWTAWTPLQTRVTGAAGVAAGELPNGDVMVVYVAFTTVYRRTSADGGATWGAPETLWNAGQIVRALCYGGNGSIFLAVDKSGGGVTVYRLYESEGELAGGRVDPRYLHGVRRYRRRLGQHGVAPGAFAMGRRARHHGHLYHGMPHRRRDVGAAGADRTGGRQHDSA